MDFSKKYFFLLPINEETNFCIDKLKVFETYTGKINNFPTTFNVIGASHYTKIPELKIIELLTCEEVQLNYKPLIIDINKIQMIEKEFLLKTQKIKIFIEVIKYNSKIIEKFKNQYQFDSKSTTGMNFLNNGYETIHTYIENNRIVITKTEFLI